MATVREFGYNGLSRICIRDMVEHPKRMELKKKISDKAIGQLSLRLYSKLYSSSYNSSSDLGHSLTIHIASNFFLPGYLTPEHWQWWNLANIAISKDGFRGSVIIVPSCNCNETNMARVPISYSTRELTAPTRNPR